MMTEENQLPEETLWVIAEYSGGKWPTVALELLGDAASLAKKARKDVAMLIFAKPEEVSEDDVKTAASYGAKTVHVLENDAFCEPNGPLLYREAIATFFQEQSAVQLLAPSTPLWIECMGVLAAKWHMNFVTEAVSFRLGQQHDLDVTRYGWGDKVQLSVSIEAQSSWCVCLRPGVAGVGRANKKGDADLFRQQVETGEDNRLSIQQLFSPDPSDIDLLEADRIITGGRGVGFDGFSTIEDIAKALGAGVGATRVAVDLGWVPYNRQVGQTGKTVKPQLYIAVGVSGASQHIDGMSESDVIIAINNDPNANIFSISHMGFIGDGREIMKHLLEKLNQSSNTESTETTSKTSV